MQYYVALIADIKGSQITGRKGSDRHLQGPDSSESLLFANELFKEASRKEVVFSAGDEVKDFENLRQLSLLLSLSMLPAWPGVLQGSRRWDVGRAP